MGHRVILVWLRAVGIVVEEVLGNGRDTTSFFESLCGNRDRRGGREGKSVVEKGRVVGY